MVRGVEVNAVSGGWFTVVIAAKGLLPQHSSVLVSVGLTQNPVVSTDLGNKKTGNRLVDSGEMEIIYVTWEMEISVLKMSQNI
jgi:hypothetical protein